LARYKQYIFLQTQLQTFSPLFKDDPDELVTHSTKKSVNLCHTELKKLKRTKSHGFPTTSDFPTSARFISQIKSYHC